jgi:cobalt-zinc-cadmium efflux system membrane fusion protein
MLRQRTATGLRCGEAQMKRIVLFFAGVAAGIGVVLLAAGWIGWPLTLRSPTQESAAMTSATTEAKHHAPGHIELGEDQVRDAGITLTKASGGMLKRHFLAPGSLIPDADHIGRVSVRVVGTVTELRKRLGDGVEKGEIVAAIESREVADAKSGYLAALLTNDLQQTLYNRQTMPRSSSTARGRNCSRWVCRKVKSPTCRASRRKACGRNSCARRSAAGSQSGASTSAV